MAEERKVSARGVYYDLTLSPYEYQSPYGDIFKFSSKKKLEIYTRDIPKEIDRLQKLLARYNLSDQLPSRMITELHAAVYKAFYCRTEGVSNGK